MKVRAALVFALIVSLAVPLTAEAQPERGVPQIGVLFFGSATDPAPNVQAFLDGLRDLGWVEGRNIGIQRRYADGRSERLAEQATELARGNIDLVMAFRTDLSDGAKNATRTIPIVMGASADPVEKGLVASLARPGGTSRALRSCPPNFQGNA